MVIAEARDPQAWDRFLSRQQFRPFLQSWTMGEVYRSMGQEIVRLVVHGSSELTMTPSILGICFGHIVPAKRGKHLAIPYGPVLEDTSALVELVEELKRIAKAAGCSFIRMSPFVPSTAPTERCGSFRGIPSPLHLLAEHIWYLPLRSPDPWAHRVILSPDPSSWFDSAHHDIELFTSMRSTTRNLIRRAEKEGVEVTASDDPVRDLQLFLNLHDETRKRHHFTPYTNAFFRAQVEHFAPRSECTLYIARHQGEPFATSIHMHCFGETSYHHGASRQSKIPASYLLQWRAIQDALRRGDHVYSFWGIAPGQLQATSYKLQADRHPFAGVTLFKTGFGGNLLELQHCIDIPLSPAYHLTRGFEIVRKWKRGF